MKVAEAFLNKMCPTCEQPLKLTPEYKIVENKTHTYYECSSCHKWIKVKNK